MISIVPRVAILCLALLAACAPAANQGAASATLAAATLQAQVSPTDTLQPIDGEILAQSVYADCPNTGQLQVAYIKEGDIWLWVQGAEPRQLTHAAEAQDLRISPDACRIAYARAVPNPAFDPSHDLPLPETYTELWIVASDGSGQQKLAGQELFSSLPAHAGASNSLYQFEWQPGSRRLAFSTQQRFSGPGLLPNGDLHLIEADFSLPVTLLSVGQGGRFVFSPDGAQIAFSTANQVGLLHADGSGLRSGLVHFPVVMTYSEYQYHPQLVWTPQGDLIFALPPEDPFAIATPDALPETTLWYLPLDGADPFEAGAVQAVEFIVQEVAFAPDASRIAYLRPLGDQRELVIALSDGSHETASFNLPEVVFGAWSPDNQHFMYAYQDAGLQLRLDDVSSTLRLPVEVPGLAAAAGVDVAWLDDTHVLLALRGAEASLYLWTMDGASQRIDSAGFGSAIYDLP